MDATTYFTDELAQQLRTHAAVSTAFGLFLLHAFNPSAGHTPGSGAVVASAARTRLVFLPAERFLADVLDPVAPAAPEGSEAPEVPPAPERWHEADYRAALAPDDMQEPAPVPEAVTLVTPEAIYDTLVRGLRARGEWRVSGFGKFLVRRARPRGAGAPVGAVLSLAPSDDLRQMLQQA